MSTKKLLPKFEVLIILVFLISFTIWAVSKCSATKRNIQEELAAEDQPVELLDSMEQRLAVDTSQASQAPKPAPPGYTRLYVTIDGLNLRKEPRLESEVLVQLKLFEEVLFMEEVTDFTEEINLGKAVAVEPWVKVKSRKGHVGWVFGAGVDYYKYKHPGVM